MAFIYFSGNLIKETWADTITIYAKRNFLVIFKWKNTNKSTLVMFNCSWQEMYVYFDGGVYVLGIASGNAGH